MPVTDISRPTGTGPADPTRGTPPSAVAGAPISLRTQILRFIATGALSAVVDFGSLWLLTQLGGLDQVNAKVISFVLGTTTAYLINRRWTFAASPSKRRFFAVVGLYAITFALQVGVYALMFRLVDPVLGAGLLNLTMVVCFVIAQAVATTVNFVVQRTVIFRAS